MYAHHKPEIRRNKVGEEYKPYSERKQRPRSPFKTPAENKKNQRFGYRYKK